MAEISSNNKRIAKNTVMLYIMMLLSTVVSLYTSRVVLQVLGVEDYGVYGVVGGVVAMFSFLNSSMAGATSRFLTFEMGKGDKERLKATFSSALIIHIGIALLVFILAETVGLWFLNNKLVIPEGRMGAAHWVFQFSVLGMFVGFTQVPYNATIIAHEKMDIYAYIELLHVFLKLGIVYLLVIGNFDKLILYALLTFVVNVIIAMIYRIYCIRHYEESKFNAHLDKDISKNILSFSAYNLLGNMGAVVNMQGTNFVINMFFGVIYNAAASIGTTISGVVTGFASNIMTAFRPQITKSYAQDNISEFQSLLSWAIKSILLIYSLIAIPVGFAIDEILSLWLVEVPVYADVFCQLLLISIFFETTRFIIIMGIHATGVVKFVSIFAGITFCLNPFIIYLLYSLNLSPAYAYVSVIFVNIILSIINVFILKHNEPRISLRKLVAAILQVIFVVLITISIVYFVCQYKTEKPFIDIIIVGTTSSILMCLLGLFVALNKEQRQRALGIIRSKIKR
jgi:O-antigen/teichoic acid export membrane protein